MIIRLLAAAMLPVALTALFTILERKSAFGSLSYKKRQLIIGLAFGGYAILSTEVGVPVEGVVMNVRDAGPLCAGLIFGAPAGIISGVIGAAHRWLCVYWGGGTYTRLACSLGTLIAGLSGAFLRKRLFDNKKPYVTYGLGLGITTEVLHMLLVLFTNLNDITYAFSFVERCAVPMIFFNGLSVALSLLVSGYTGKEEKFSRKPPFMNYDLAFRLLVCILTAFFITSFFTYRIHSALSDNEAENLLELNIKDVRYDMSRSNFEEIMADIPYRRVGQTGGIIIMDSDLNIIEAGYNAKRIAPDKVFDTPPDTVEVGQCVKINIAGIRSYCTFGKYGQYFIGAYIPEDEATFLSNVSLYMMVFMEILIFASLFVLIYEFIRKKVINNLKIINKDLNAITSGELNTVIDVHDYKEFESLSNHINSTVDTLKHYIADAEARIDKELEFAKQIQHSALPSVFPPYPERKDFELYASMDTAKEVGGDFYDFYLLDRYNLIFIIADVSGKGIPAAMFMMTAKTLIKGLAESGRDVDEVFNIANEKLCESNEAGMFVTAWMGKLDLSTGKLTFVNAGHNPPIICRKNGKAEYLKTKPNLVLAGMDITRYRKNELMLEPGDAIYLYTDGVTEANNINEELYGEERLKKCLEAAADKNTEEICREVKSGVDKFSDGAPQADDITMLAVKVNTIQSPDTITSYPCIESAQLVYDYLSDRMEKFDIPLKVMNRVQVVADEIYSNIFNYSGATKSSVTIKRSGNDLVLTFRDNGNKYDPTKAEEPDISLSVEERGIGGLGILMVRRMTKNMEYSYENGFNCLKLVFDLEK